MTARPTTDPSTAHLAPQAAAPFPPAPAYPGPQAFPQAYPEAYPQAYPQQAYPQPYAAAPFGPPPRRRRTGRIVGIAAVVLAVLVALGVGGVLLLAPRTVEPESVQREIVRITETAVQVAPTDVRCPQDIRAQGGATFTCTATIDRQPITYTVRQDDDEGHLTIGNDRILRIPAVESTVAGLVTEDIDIQVSVTCEPPGRTVLVNSPGTPIACTATNAADPTDSAGITVTVAADGSAAYTFD